MFLTKFLSDENVVEIEGMDGEGIFFYCHRSVQDKQSAMRIVTMMTICFMKFLRATRMWELKHRITKVHNCHHGDDVELLPRSGGSVGRGLEC